MATNNLILITNHFPFGMAEAFLENELHHLINNFDKVIILTRNVSSENQRLKNLNYTYYRINPKSSFIEKLKLPWLLIRNFRRVFSYIKEELIHLGSNKNSISFPVISILLHDLSKALITSSHLKKIIKKEGLQDKVILYSYWLTNSALATLFTDVNNVDIKRISRAHAGDVYAEHQKHLYLGFRKVLAKHLDKIFSISNNAAQYIIKDTNSDSSKVVISRLGTMNPPNLPPKTERDDKFIIVSCSFIHPRKRLFLLIDALSHIHNYKIHWVHIGDGEQKLEIEKLAAQRLKNKSNITYHFSGGLTNNEILKYYENNFIHLFLNTSISEGVPVTIMEAQSFGMPVLAPAVGGIPEIVSNENGRLFNKDASSGEIAKSIEDFINMPQDSYYVLRKNARINWERGYKADYNFPTFAKELLKL